ncbi:MAG TPA: type II toxin-antitoxin system RelE/ParE family toxin [Candidatus Acidoferrum sp.]|nr:type II toxin-antitoxin system RelE/ParE family toxin [Candidatus Acidoferrum sp.]
MSASKRPRFLLDLAEELAWLQTKAGADIAERWYDALLDTVQFIEKNPFVGRERTDLLPVGIRSWRVRSFPRWLIFYAVTPSNDIVFYRVRSGTMNLVVMKMES